MMKNETIMKITFTLLLGLIMVSMGACKDDDPVAPVKKFADYTRADIIAVQANITADAVTYDAQGLTNFKAASILLFKTSSGNYGKMEVVSVDANYNLTMNLVVYDANGVVLVQKTALVLANNNDAYDLDDPDMPVVVSADADFGWATLQGFRTIYVANGAKLLLFKI
jgi:hypothetical protein